MLTALHGAIEHNPECRAGIKTSRGHRSPLPRNATEVPHLPEPQVRFRLALEQVAECHDIPHNFACRLLQHLADEPRAELPARAKVEPRVVQPSHAARCLCLKPSDFLVT